MNHTATEIERETAVFCDGCGETIAPDGWTFEQDGDVYCRDCFNSTFVKCHGCDEYIKQDDATIACDGEAYCETCLNDSFFCCPDCEEYKSCDDSVTVYYRDRSEWRMKEKTVCDSCADRNYIRCEDCGSYYPEDMTYDTGHEYSVCSDCYEDHYGLCDGCGEVYHHDNLIYSDRRDDTYCESCYRERGCGSIQDYHYKPSPKYRHFNQTTPNKTALSRQPGNRLYLGFELEVESLRESADSVATDLIADYDDGEELFYCKHDGSLNDGFEVVSHPLTLRAHKVQDYSDMLQSLKQAGCRSHDVDTCGLHVHVSRAFFTQSELVKLGLFVYFNKSRLEVFARRSENSYAKFKPVNRSNYLESAESNGRYEAINFEPHNTVEFRLFKGTLNVETFLATLEFCDAVSRFVKTVSACTIARNNGGFESFKTFVNKDGNRKIYKNLLAYLESRGL